MHRGFALSLILLLGACGSSRADAPVPDAGGGTDTAVRPDGTSPPVMMVNNNVPLPPPRTNPSDLLSQAVAACERATAMLEQRVATSCMHNPDTQATMDQFAELHAELIGRRPLPGRDREAYTVLPSEVTLSGEDIEVISCRADPLCTEGDCGPRGMNAFAIKNIAVTIDPLIFSFAEGAAYWGTLVEEAGGDPNTVNVDTLFTGLGTIYAAHAQGRGFSTIDQGTVATMLEENDFVNEMFVGVTAFLFMHELAHAELGHGIINHTAAMGAQSILAAEGRTLTPEESAEIQAELRTLKVFTESQADIYAATLLREGGFSSAGPVVLFTGAMAAYYVAAGGCSASMTQQELYDCAVMNNPNAGHPPLDVRATVLRRIVDEGEDLSSELELISPPSL